MSVRGSDKGYRLKVQDVYKQYGDHVVLDNIDLAVKAGELCTVVGPSGCGKSTLLRLILGQERPTAGGLLIDEQPVGYPNMDRGIVYQRYSLYPHLSVIDNVLLGKTLPQSWWARKRIKRAHRDDAMNYLERVRLADHAQKYPHELSGGMQQRVAIAQAIITHPKILLMDEPFGALDPDTREDLQLFLLELWEQEAMTVFFVTHDLQEAMYLGTRLLVLSQYYTDDRGDNDGVRRGAKIVADYALPPVAAPSDIKNKPEFLALLEDIRSRGFDPEVRQHASEFNFSHADAYQTLTEEEHSLVGPIIPGSPPFA